MMGALRSACRTVLLTFVTTIVLVCLTAVSASADAAGDCTSNGGVWNDRFRTCDTDYGGEVSGGDATTIPVVKKRGGEAPRCYNDSAGGREEVPCLRGEGAWNGTCYVKHVADPPEDRRTDFRDAMANHDDGVVISCYYPVCDSPEDVRHDQDADLLQCPVYHWAPDADPVDPALIAQEIWASLRKSPIDIGVAPYDKPDHVGYVGIGTWYWVEDYRPRTVGPIKGSDSSQGFTVVAGSEVDHIEWDLGNGEVLNCPPDSMAYEEGKNLGDRYPEGSPDCGYVFQEMGTYQITATAVWEEFWAGLGQRGTREFPLSSETEIRIGELQVLRQ